jgi:hypothetical protein
MIWKGFYKKPWPIRVIIPGFSRTDSGKKYTSIGLADVPAEIRSEHLQNTSIDLYRNANRLSTARFHNPVGHNVRNTFIPIRNTTFLRLICSALANSIAKLTVAQFANKFPAIYETRSPITVLHILSQMNPVHSHPISLRSVLILPSQFCVGLYLSCFLLFSSVSIKILHIHNSYVKCLLHSLSISSSLI